MTVYESESRACMTWSSGEQVAGRSTVLPGSASKVGLIPVAIDAIARSQIAARGRLGKEVGSLRMRMQVSFYQVGCWPSNK